jgi:hypothetical protein
MGSGFAESRRHHGLSDCEKEGPMEKAGKKVERVVDTKK